jgi:hypothetical protein
MFLDLFGDYNRLLWDFETTRCLMPDIFRGKQLLVARGGEGGGHSFGRIG